MGLPDFGASLIQERQEERSEVTQVLEAAWKLIKEGRELIGFATQLIMNTTERQRWVRCRRIVERLGGDVQMLLAAWDESPTGQKVRQDERPTTR